MVPKGSAIIISLVISYCHAFSVKSVNQNFLSHRARSNVNNFQRRANRVTRATGGSSTLQMRDLSSANWFKVGDKVKVVSSVMKAGFDLKSREGVVIQTWEKCDVDPTCCCAEFVDESFAVTVKFQGDTNTNSPPTTGDISSSFTHFFAEDELLKVDHKDRLPFDGMSCKAFKLDQLKMGEQARRIAEFEASQSSNNDDLPSLKE